MSTLMNNLHVPVGVAGVAAILLAVADAWFFHSFGIQWDKDLVIAALAALGGTGVGYVAGKPTGQV